MRELVRTNDIVLVSAVGALLDGADIHHLVLDQNMSVIEGSLGVLPRRILVHEDDIREARLRRKRPARRVVQHAGADGGDRARARVRQESFSEARFA